MNDVEDLRIKIFADGADKADMMRMYQNPMIKGFTTNPTLMRKAGVENYENFARDIIEAITDRPISFEVFADDFSEMEAQALAIASWGDNVFVKIPVMNTQRESSARLIRRLTSRGVKVNVTAIMTCRQVEEVSLVLNPDIPAVVSVFAGRIADTGCDPVPIIEESVRILKEYPCAEVLWASPRELLNVFQANDVGCHIITATTDVLNKLKLVGKDLLDYSQETVQMFHSDACNAGFVIETSTKAHVA